MSSELMSMQEPEHQRDNNPWGESPVVVRNPTDLEVEKAALVASKAFPNLPLEHWQKSFHDIAETFGTAFVLIAELDGEIVSSLLCCPAPVHVGGELVPHSSVGAVGTHPDYRHKGCAGALMAQCAKLLRKEGIYISSLWPFSYEYYRKFGWEVGAEVREYTAAGEFFAGLGDANRVRAAAESDLGEIKSIYPDFARRYSGPTQRSDQWWTRIARIGDYLDPVGQPQRGSVVHVTNNEVDAYAAYLIEPRDEKTAVSVREMVFFEASHRRDMLAFVGGIDPEARMSFGAPDNDIFLHELANPRAVEARVQPAFQFRVVDPERAIESLRVDADVSGRLTFSISDPVFEHGFEFGIEIDNGGISLCKPDSSRAIRTDVQTLAKMYSGYLTAYDAWSLGKVSVPGDKAAGILELACRVFPALRPYRSWLEPG